MTVRHVYLDANATTPLDPRALRAMLPHLTAGANASSAHHAGRTAAQAIEESRAHVAALLGARPREIVFTSGATEANNLAIKGVALGGHRRHLVSCTTEHKAVLGPMEALARAGFSVTLVRVTEHGVIDLDELRDAVTSETALVSVMAANNETGTLAPLREVSQITHSVGAAFHTDATQLVPWGAVDVDELGIDLLSLSAHKMHAPQGVGALYVRRDLATSLVPLIDGGGHERGLRSGTLNTAGIVGLGEAARIVGDEAPVFAPRVRQLRDRLHAELQAGLDVTLNGHPTERAPGTLNVCIGEDVDADALVAALPDVAVATGSACTSAVPAPSHVLTAMGHSPEHAASSLRLSLSRMTTADEIDYATERVCRVVRITRDRMIALGALR